jgi:hypothetical protein
MYTQAQFFLGESAIYQGIHNSTQSWNGFACPAFDLPTVKQMMRDGYIQGIETAMVDGVERVYFESVETCPIQHEGVNYYHIGFDELTWEIEE